MHNSKLVQQVFDTGYCVLEGFFGQQVREQIVCSRRFGSLNLALDFSNTVQILVDARSVGRPNCSLEACNVIIECVEKTGPPSEGGLPLFSGAAFAEESLEHDPRMCL